METPSLDQALESSTAPDAGPVDAAAAAAALRAAGIEHLHTSRLEALAQEVHSNWAGAGDAPAVLVLQSMQDPRTPESALAADRRQRAAGARGTPKAFIIGNTIYLVADALSTKAEAFTSLIHEAVGHWGLRRVHGDRLNDILDEVASKNRMQVWAKAKAYGLSMDDAAQRREAAEEVLADLAQEDRDPTLLEILEAESRALLRQLVPSMRDEPFTRAELLANFIAPVRERMRRGIGQGRAAGQATSPQAQATSPETGGGARGGPEGTAPAPSRRALQARMKSLGLPANMKTADMAEIVRIVSAPPRQWSRKDFDMVLRHLSIHQDVRKGSADRVASIMKNGLSSGMVDSLEALHRGNNWSWARSLLGTEAYIFLSGQLRYLPNGSPYLAPGNKPLCHIRPDKGMDVYEALATAKTPAEMAEELAGEERDRLDTGLGTGLYSELEHRIGIAPMTAGSPQAWQQYIKGLSLRGVRKEEVEWSGAIEWLAKQPGKVSRDALLAHLRANPVKVRAIQLTPSAEGVGSPAAAGTSPYAGHSDYTLPGGSNHREILLTLQRGTDSTSAPGAPGSDGVRASAKGENYKSAHWDQQNVLVHIRLNDRVDEAGRRILFVEEIQSDWGQRGRKHGFLEEIDGKSYSHWSSECDRLFGAWRTIGDDKHKAWETAVNNRNALQHQTNAVPPAPFVRSTEAWVALGLKHVLKEACDGGYAAVAFISGEQARQRFKPAGDNGQGLVSFYDNLVPTVVRTLLRKMGDSRVSAVQMRRPLPTGPREDDGAGGMVQRTVPGPPEPQFGFQITDRLHSIVSGGLPLFRRDEATPAGTVAPVVPAAPDPALDPALDAERATDAQAEDGDSREAAPVACTFDLSALTLHHGTRKTFDALRPDAGSGEFGIYFTPDLAYARQYAGSGDSARIIEAKVNLKNPILVATKNGLTRERAEQLRAMGHDGVVTAPRASGPQLAGLSPLTADIIEEVVAFDPEQVSIISAARPGASETSSVTSPVIGSEAGSETRGGRDTFQADLFGGFAAREDSVARFKIVSSRGAVEIQAKGNVDSAGRQICTTRQGLENFWDWYEDSELLTNGGAPLTLYHATTGDFGAFETMRPSRNTGLFGATYEARRAGIFMTPEVGYAEWFIDGRKNGSVMPVYANITKLADFRSGLTEQLEKDMERAGLNTRYLAGLQYDWEMFDEEFGGPDFVAALQRAGYDGAAINDLDEHGKTHVSYIAFSPEQVKSALGNRGTWNPREVDIRFRRQEEKEGEAPLADGGTQSAAFQAWFGDSKVVDDKGEPLVVYHGTALLKDRFSREGGGAGVGAYFTTDAGLAAEYASMDAEVGDGEGPLVMPVYLSLKNPKTMEGMDSYSVTPQVRDALEAQGFDGIYNPEAREYIAFRPEQVKSAIGNNGDFDSTNPDIRFKRQDEASDTQPPADEGPQSEAFQAWFGDSKLVDAEGKPLVLYRGEQGGGERNIYTVDRKRSNDLSIFLTPDREVAAKYEGGRYGPKSPREFYVKADRLLDLTQDTREARAFIAEWAKSFDQWIDRQSGEEVDPFDVVQDGRLFDYEGDWSGERWRSLQAAALENHDAAYLTDWDNGPFTALIVRGGAQIKSANRNNGDFDSTNPDIRFKRQDEAPGETPPESDFGRTAFQAWFGKSKGVDEAGQPKIVYHGTASDFSEFMVTRSGEFGPAIYTTDNAREASEYGAGQQRPGINVMPLYVSISNPYTKGVEAFWDEFGADDGDAAAVARARAAGYDGVIAQRPDTYYDNQAHVFVDRGEMLTHYVAFDPGQVKSAIGNNGQYDTQNPDIRFSREGAELGLQDSPTWYSALAEAVESAAMKAGGAGAWKDLLKNWTTTGRAKADEIAWSGLDEWLDLQPGKITKAQVSEYLVANGVKVTETILGGDAPRFEAARDRIVAAGFEIESDDYFGITLRRDGAQVDSEDLTPQQQADLETLEEGSEAEAPLETGSAKYAKFTLPGGTNYREVLLTLPQPADTRTTIQALAEKLRAKYGGAFLAPDSGMTDAERAEYEEAGRATERELGAGTKGYRSTHWDQVNVLAHIRVNDRIDSDGARVLFVEEIQSDWAQQGKKEGFQPGAAGQRRFQELGGEWDTLQPAAAAGDRDAAARQGEISDEMNAISDAKRDGLPAAPYVGNTDKWLALALKRVIKIAVDGNYDKVAFVTGAQSAERYDLSKQVDSIGWGAGAEWIKGETRGVNIAYARGGSSDFTVNADGQVVDGPSEMFGKRLDELVGKDIADKIMASKSGKLQGADLKVGGDGMRAFYDKIVPAVLKTVLKGLGGGQVSAVQVGEETSNWAIVDATDDGDNQVLDDGFTTREAAEAAQASGHEGGTEVRNLKSPGAQPGFSITPAMRDKARGGMPMFSRGEVHTSSASGADLDRAWRDLTSRNTFSDYDVPAATRVSGTTSDFVLSREDGDQSQRWAALNVREFRRDDGALVYTPSLEVGAAGFPAGTGAATVMYLQALRIAQQRGLGWLSEGMRSDAALSLYERLTAAGIPFEQAGGSSYVSAQTLEGVDLARVAATLSEGALSEGHTPAAFSRGGVTTTTAFQRWFKNSKVVDDKGHPLRVWHGTTETKPVPGSVLKGELPARQALVRLANAYGIADWTSVPSVLERWLAMGMATERGVTPEMATEARLLLTRARDRVTPPSEVMGFDVFNIPAGQHELGAHFGTAQQASAFGDSFDFYLNLQNPLRLPDLGTWHYQSVMREARKQGVSISTDEYTAVFAAADNNQALRELLLSKGIDGIVYRNEAEGRGDSYIAFKTEQIKSASANSGDFDAESPSVRLRRSDGDVDSDKGSNKDGDVAGRPGITVPQTETAAFKAWFGMSKVVVDAGGAGTARPREVYHGTTHDFSVFGDRLKNVEGNLGGGHYFTSSPIDAATNYACVGPDLTNRIELEAARLEAEASWHVEADGDAADLEGVDLKKLAAERLVGHGGFTMPAYLRIERPFIIGGADETKFAFTMERFDDEGSWQPMSGSLCEFFEVLRLVVSNRDCNDADASTAMAKVIEDMSEDGETSIGAAALLKTILTQDGGIAFATDVESALNCSGELVRQAIERMGFDGIIDNTVWEKFGTNRKYRTGMKGMDQDTVHYIVFQPEQIKSSIANNGEFSRESADIRFRRSDEQEEAGVPAVEAPIAPPEPSPPVFVSVLHERLKTAPGRATAAQWAGYLRGLSEKGVSQQEIRWSHLLPWLEAMLPDRRVNRDEILNRFESFGPRMTEEILLDPAPMIAEVMAALKSDAGFCKIYPGFRVVLDDDSELAAPPVRVRLAGAPTEFLEVEHLPHKLRAAVEEITSRHHLLARYNSYKLPGGKNYRELLIQLEPRARISRYLEDTPAAHSPRRSAQVVMVNGARHEFESAAAAKAFESTIPKDPSFNSPHWAQPRVLSHVRLEERTGPSGSRTLFVTEIQSDWAQIGRQTGFTGRKPVEVALVRQAAAVREGGLPLWEAIATSGHVVTSGGPPHFKSPEDLLDHARKLLQAKQARGLMVAEAPFVGRTRDWTALSIKRVLRLAADEGFDSVAFVNGDQALHICGKAEHHFTEVEAYKVPSFSVFEGLGGEPDAEMFKVELTEGGQAVHSGIFTARELPAVVGSDVASRIVAEARVDQNLHITGLDLKTGGDGMRAFYDEIVPGVLRDVLRKLGAPAPGLAAVDAGMSQAPSGGEQAGPRLDRQLCVDMTPELRRRLASGVPMFSRGGPAPAAAAAPTPTAATTRAEVDHGLRSQQEHQAYRDFRHLLRVWNDLTESERDVLRRRHGGADLEADQEADQDEADPLLEQRPRCRYG